MLRWYRSLKARREEKRPRTEDEMRAWILETLRRVSNDPWLNLFYVFDPGASTVTALACDHGHRRCCAEDCGAVRIRDWLEFYSVFRDCERVHRETPIREGTNLVIGFGLLGYTLDFFPNEISVSFYDKAAFERGFRSMGSTDHDCDAGCCTSGDLC